MLAIIVVFFQGIEYYLQMFFIAEEIGISGIDKKCFYIVLFDIMRIGFLDIEEVFIRDILFIGTVSLF